MTWFVRPCESGAFNLIYPSLQPAQLEVSQDEHSTWRPRQHHLALSRSAGWWSEMKTIMRTWRSDCIQTCFCVTHLMPSSSTEQWLCGTTANSLQKCSYNKSHLQQGVLHFWCDMSWHCPDHMVNKTFQGESRSAGWSLPNASECIRTIPNALLAGTGRPVVRWHNLSTQFFSTAELDSLTFWQSLESVNICKYGIQHSYQHNPAICSSCWKL